MTSDEDSWPRRRRRLGPRRLELDTYFCNFADLDNSNNSSVEPTGTCERCAGLPSARDCDARGASPLGARECLAACDDVDGTLPPCDGNEDCEGEESRSSFCDDERRVCRRCPQFCGTEPLDGTSLENCVDACNEECSTRTAGFVSVGDALRTGEGLEPSPDAWDVSVADDIVTGPLVTCQSQGNLACPDARNDSICVFPDITSSLKDSLSLFNDASLQCRQSGGIAMAYYRDGFSPGQGQVFAFFEDEPIPALRLSQQDMQELLEIESGLQAEITTRVKKECSVQCSDRVSCPSSPNNLYCNYKKIESGYCKECLPGTDYNEQADDVRPTGPLSYLYTNLLHVSCSRKISRSASSLACP